MHDKSYITKYLNMYLYSERTMYGNLENKTSENIKITTQLGNIILIIVVLAII